MLDAEQKCNGTFACIRLTSATVIRICYNDSVSTDRNISRLLA